MKRIVLFPRDQPRRRAGAVGRAARARARSRDVRADRHLVRRPARLLGRRRLHRRDHLAADVEADGEVVDRRARDRTAGATSAEAWLVETVRRLADEGRHRHARGRDLRGRAQRVRDRRVQEFGAGRGLDRTAAVDEQGGGRGGARPRDRARRERRHGDADADPGRGQHVRRVLRAHHRRRSSTRRCSAPSAATDPATSSP